MVHVSVTTAEQHESAPGFEGHYSELDGFMVGFESYSEDADLAPLFAGLPDDRCQSPHWGLVLRGKLAFRTSGGQEVVNAGDAYYVAPGHTPVIFAGTEIVEFSPAEAFRQTMEVVARNLAEAGA